MTKPELSGAVRGADRRLQAIALAGAVAELGQTRLVIQAAGRERELHARETDLPGEVEQAPAGSVLEAPGLRATFVIGAETISWSALDADAAAALARAFGASGSG